MSGASGGDIYLSTSQQQLLAVYLRLCEQPLFLLSPAALAEATGHSRDQVYRSLKNLERAGLAEQAGSEWRVAPQAARLSERVRLALADLHRSYLGQEGQA